MDVDDQLCMDLNALKKRLTVLRLLYSSDGECCQSGDKCVLQENGLLLILRTAHGWNN